MVTSNKSENSNNKKLPRHIALIRLSAMGDVAMLAHTVRAFQEVYPDDWGKQKWMAIIADDQVFMANLCLATCFAGQNGARDAKITAMANFFNFCV